MADQAETDRLLNARSDPGVKLYKYRWFILALYSLTALSSTLIWLSLTCLTDTTLLTSISFPILQIIVAVPIAIVPARFGLRRTMISLGTCNAIAITIIILAPYWKGSYLLVIGQFIASISSSLLPHLAPETSAVWFAKQEQAISTSIGIILGNLGADVAFLQPAKWSPTLEDDFMCFVSGSEFTDLAYFQAALCALVLVLIVFMYRERPPLPPSTEEALRRKPGDISVSDFFKCVKDLSRNVNFLLVGNALALTSALSTMVPLMLLWVLGSIGWFWSTKSYGLIGYGSIIIGFIGCICFGKILAKSEAHTTLAIALSVAMITDLLLIVFTVQRFAFRMSFVVIVALFSAYQFFLFPFVQLLVVVMSEIIYPIPSSIAYVMSIAVSRVYIVMLIFLAVLSQGLECLIMGLVTFFCLLLFLYSKFRRNRSTVESEMTAAFANDDVRDASDN